MAVNYAKENYLDALNLLDLPHNVNHYKGTYVYVVLGNEISRGVYTRTYVTMVVENKLRTFGFTFGVYGGLAVWEYRRHDGKLEEILVDHKASSLVSNWFLYCVALEKGSTNISNKMEKYLKDIPYATAA